MPRRLKRNSLQTNLSRMIESVQDAEVQRRGW
jgi:hypothetical protein